MLRTGVNIIHPMRIALEPISLHQVVDRAVKLVIELHAARLGNIQPTHRVLTGLTDALLHMERDMASLVRRVELDRGDVMVGDIALVPCVSHASYLEISLLRTQVTGPCQVSPVLIALIVLLATLYSLAMTL